eukprot:TRINITY_DN10633_c0_g1_i1.p1 TRINITY_DN10633_c0_g1~~TRINITY_DN10633_c0_g1_i1.p1  ORF type:complete len:280 (-),score=45.18 TRINITY_DN10633_c0_g1_i1:136-975(-)
MWSALENIALRESLPVPLETGQSIRGILIGGQLDQGRYNLHYLGRRRSKPYLLKQFYSIDTNAFLRWQNEARFIPLRQEPGFVWPNEEWRGGLISPFPEGISLRTWLEKGGHSPDERLRIASRLGSLLSRLHASGIAHRGLSPDCVRIGDEDVEISNFGNARCNQWDDLWTDSALSIADAAYASPDLLRGSECGYAEDVYAFGAILHLVLSGRAAFGTVKRLIRPMFPRYVIPDRLHAVAGIPDGAQKLVPACMASLGNRPSMPQLSAELDRCLSLIHI